MKQTNRNSNIELLRIFSIFMIIAYHIYFHTIDTQLTDLSSIMRLNNGWFCYPDFFQSLYVLAFIAPLGKVGNVIFILISGYFMIQKGKDVNLIKISKKLLLQLGYTSIALTIFSYVIFKLSNGVFINLLDIKIFNSRSWFVGYYFIIIVIAALFLNEYLTKIDKKAYLTFLLVVFALVQFSWTSGVIDSFAHGLKKVATGIFLYALGGYIQLYKPFDKIKTYMLILLIAVTYGFVFLSFYNVTMTNIQMYQMEEKAATFIQEIPQYGDSSIVSIILGVCLFEIFRRIPMKENKVINFIASSTFMIYLLHDNKFFYSLWDTTDWITLLAKNPWSFTTTLLSWIGVTFIAGFSLYLSYLLLGRIFTYSSE